MGKSRLSRWKSIETHGLLAQGQNQVSTLQQRTNKILTTSPFGNTYEADVVSHEVEVGVVVGLKCMQPSWDTDLWLHNSNKALRS